MIICNVLQDSYVGQIVTVPINVGFGTIINQCYKYCSQQQIIVIIHIHSKISTSYGSISECILDDNPCQQLPPTPSVTQTLTPSVTQTLTMTNTITNSSFNTKSGNSSCCVTVDTGQTYNNWSFFNVPTNILSGVIHYSGTCHEILPDPYGQFSGTPSP